MGRRRTGHRRGVVRPFLLDRYEIVYGILASGASEGSTGERSEPVGVSDNERKYYSLERAREVLGYDPQDNSAEWDGDEEVS